MSKIMLVEDDNNLREIYEARLLAEGYEIVSAKDGEEALALAVKEKPDLIISDVMMPKISGFDMLDILRSTPETKNTKVIMMTALSQAEDKTRADKLGADRYLVKSQVTLEDVAKVAKEVLTGETAAPAAAPVPEAPAPAAETAAAPAAETPAVVATETATAPAPAPAPDPVPAPAPEPPVVAPAPEPPAPEPPADPNPLTPAAPAPEPAAAADTTQAQSTADEASNIQDQINAFVATAAEAAPLTEPPAETPIEVTAAPVDSTDAAADNAAKLAEVVNNVMGNTDEPETTKANGDGVSGKKIISPINDLSVKPDLEKLAAEQEAMDTATAAVQNPSATSVVTPAGDVVAPPTAEDDAPAAGPKPGDKIDPNSVAL